MRSQSIDPINHISRDGGGGGCSLANSLTTPSTIPPTTSLPPTTPTQSNTQLSIPSKSDKETN